MSATPVSPPAALQARLQEFNLLPSRSLHPERARLLAPPDANPASAALARQPAVQRALHRSWSAQLLAQLGEHAQPLLDLSHAALPLALAAPPLLARIARDAGVTLLGGHLRRSITRDAVQHARAALGDASLDWARHGAAALHPGLEDARPWLAPGLDHAADLLGAGLIAQAWNDAPAPLRMRADWKLAPAAVDTPAVRAASALDALGARQLCLQLLARLDSAWLSSFPATR
jgi:type III secretion protein K